MTLRDRTPLSRNWDRPVTIVDDVGYALGFGATLFRLGTAADPTGNLQVGRAILGERRRERCRHLIIACG